MKIITFSSTHDHTFMHLGGFFTRQLWLLNNELNGTWWWWAFIITVEKTNILIKNSSVKTVKMSKTQKDIEKIKLTSEQAFWISGNNCMTIAHKCERWLVFSLSHLGLLNEIYFRNACLKLHSIEGLNQMLSAPTCLQNWQAYTGMLQ